MAQRYARWPFVACTVFCLCLLFTSAWWSPPPSLLLTIPEFNRMFEPDWRSDVHLDKLTPRVSPVQFIDGVMLNDELDLLAVRLHELRHCVDYHIVVESPYTLRNEPKPLHFQRNMHTDVRFTPFLHKIIHVVVDEPLEKGQFQYWENEVRFRDAIGKVGLKRIPGLIRDDLVMVSDVDEIPDARVVCFLKRHRGYPPVVRLRLRALFASFAWMNPSSTIDTPAVVSVGVLLDHDGSASELRRVGLALSTPQARVGSVRHPAGWHCSWCLPLSSWSVKLTSFAHRELDTPENNSSNSDEKYRHLKRNGLWFDGHTRHKRVQPHTLHFAPQYVMQSKELEYLWKPEVDGNARL